MGLLEPYSYKTKEGKKYWLHMNRKGKVILYYFSKERTGAMFNIPKGFEVTKNSRQDFPMLKRKVGGMFGGFMKNPSAKKEEPAQEAK
jgi:hypothetical protein